MLGRWLSGPLAMALTLLLGAGLAWQTARIEGWPFMGGGLKDRISTLKDAAARHDLADANARATALAARARWIAQGQAEAHAHLAAAKATRQQIRTIVKKVPVYVSAKSDSACVVPWGAVRLLDAAASGRPLADVRAALAPTRPDDAPSDVSLSEIVTVLAENLGRARRNASQLRHLQAALDPGK